jgi:hypothetical protein
MNAGGYEIEDCQRMIDRCKANIATLQAGIDREQASIDHFEIVKADLEKKAAAEAEADGVQS